VGGGEIGLRGDFGGVVVVAVVALIEVPVVGAAAVAAMVGVAGMGRAIGVEVEAVRTVIFGDSVWMRRFRGIRCFPLLPFVVRKRLVALLVKELGK